ncbi:probable inactive protein kinase DDB_G0270444 [Uranotaenia lowii]|uniref:probable inactive protein kinase DDB_G0270444 n=1 Tax=Uranotaenia lowii TaxID=190385 RepID=UPI002479360B|nr:probable inactive protein kinase DDB_G0270444 [Uranotaenia lowii]
MSVVQSNISTTIRSFNISDDIRIEVKKFRTDAGIEEIDIEDDEDDISVIQKIHKTFADPGATDFDPETLKSIIVRLDEIEKNLENIIYMNAQADSLNAMHMNGLINRQFITASPAQLAQLAAVQAQQQQQQQQQQQEVLEEEAMIQDEIVDEIQLEMDSDENDLIGEFIEQDELKLVEFPINQVDDLRELEESIVSDQESLVSFVNFLGTTIQKHNRNLEPILKDFVTESLISELGFNDGEINMMSFYIFNQLLFDVWKNDYSTMNDYRNQLRKISNKIQNRARAAARTRIRQ